MDIAWHSDLLVVVLSRRLAPSDLPSFLLGTLVTVLLLSGYMRLLFAFAVRLLHLPYGTITGRHHGSTGIIGRIGTASTTGTARLPSPSYGFTLLGRASS